MEKFVAYFQFSSGLVHLVVAQMHHESGQSILSLLSHVSISVLQAGVELRNTQHQVARDRPQSGQLLSQPAEHLCDEGQGNEM